MDITHAIIIESYHKCMMVKFQRWGRILDLEVEFITPTHDLFFLHFFALEMMSDIVLWHSNIYFYFITLHAAYSAKGDIVFLAGKKVIKIVYLCNTIKFSIVIYSIKVTFISKDSYSVSSAFIIYTLIKIIVCIALTPQIQESKGWVASTIKIEVTIRVILTVVRCSFLAGRGGGELKFCKWDLLQSVKFCLTFLLPDPTTQDVEDEEDDDYIDELFCVACNKAFKSERA